MQGTDALPASLSPFSAEFIATVLSKLPGEEVESEKLGAPDLEHGHSHFLDSLLGIQTAPAEPAILPAAGKFSLVGCIAESVADVDDGGHEQADLASDEAVAATPPVRGDPLHMLEDTLEVRI